MKNRFSKIFSILFPGKKTNLFVLLVVILGIISGSIFLIVLKDSDKELIINKIKTFIDNINSNNINNLDAFKNAIIENGIYILLIWLLGFSVIGIIFNVFLIYLKGFITGFSISSLILVYRYKGILASLLYVFPSVIINLFVTTILGIYSFTFTILLIKSIFNKSNSILIKNYIKKYFLIFIFSIILIIISSLAEAFIFPSLIKVIIKLFI